MEEVRSVFSLRHFNRHIRVISWASALLSLIIGTAGCGSGNSPAPTPPPTNNPAPSVISLSETSTAAGGTGLSVSIHGANFISSSKVYWNSSSRPTTVKSVTEVSFEVTAADIASPGTAAITVVNPGPGGGTSSPLTFSFQPNVVQLWRFAEFALDAQKSYANPFVDNGITCEFDGPNGERLNIAGFYDGSGTWKVRFAPTSQGTWTYRTAAQDTQDKGVDSITGTIDVSAPVPDNSLYAHGGILKVSSTGRYLTYSDGTPFFWLGDFWSFVPSSAMPYENFKVLVDKRKQQKFSVFQVAFTVVDADTAEWHALMDNAKKRKVDLAFWQNVDRYFAYGNENGLVPAIALAFHSAMDLGDLEDWEFIWSYVVARYGAESVTWFVCGEYNLDNVPERVQKVLDLGAYIKSIDPYKRAMSVHPWWFGGEQRQAWGQSWYDFTMIQSGHWQTPNIPGGEVYTEAWSVSPPRPVLEDECDFEGIYAPDSGEITPAQVRRVAYRAIQMGSFGYTYGAHGLWYPTQSETDTHFWSDWGVSPPWWVALERPGAEQMRIMREVYESVEWWKMEPRPTAILPVATMPELPWQPTVKSIGDEVYMIYFPEGLDKNADFQLQLTESTSTSFVGKWVDPLTGARTSVPETINCVAGKCALPERSTNGDWILILSKP